MTIYTFDYFWSEFHRINPKRKTDKYSCFKLWTECKFSDLKEKSIKEITKTRLSALEYLRKMLDYSK